MPTGKTTFEWDAIKDRMNREKHGVSFSKAQLAFFDENRVILADTAHSHREPRFCCVGKVADAIMTVRFTYREGVIRIFGAGYWRKGKRIYDKENQLHGRTNG
uniref:Uncharacterized protein n=1 Tax=Candidatus Kentrum sp. DK TaxID=2126562 RepID=A0A450TLE9_9GAMM|nr:MAG: hypothetical protein BECKDK2373B_GA0170837_12153 [Candidatus Kentron sp. DK]